MEYLLDKYVFDYLPFAVGDATKKTITLKAVDLLRIADWACKAQDIRKLAANQTSLLVVEAIFLLLFILTFMHSLRHGRRYVFTWFGIMFIGSSIECLRFINSSWDIVWHAQGTLTYFGMRIPCYVCGVYQFVFYVSYVFVRRLYLCWWAEGPAAGLISMLLFFPLNLFGVKLLWFQWHDSDIAVIDRWFSIPWTAILFLTSVSCHFLWILQLFRKIALPENYDWKLFVREFFCASTAGILSVFTTAVQTEVLVHFIRGILNINMVIPTFTFLGIFALLFFTNDRHNNRRKARPRGEVRYWFDELFCAISINYLFFMFLPFVTDPSTIISEGLHQPIGLCNITEQYSTLVGTIAERKKYYCPYNQSATCFDFHCLPSRVPPKPYGIEPLEWYPICGTDYENRWEYLLLIWSFSLLSIGVLYQIGSRSGSTPLDTVKSYIRYGKVRSMKRPNKGSFIEEEDPEDFSSNFSSRRGSDDTENIDLWEGMKNEPGLQKKFFGGSLESSVISTFSGKLPRDSHNSSSLLKTRKSSACRATKVKNVSTFEYSESPRTLRARKRCS